MDQCLYIGELIWQVIRANPLFLSIFMGLVALIWGIIKKIGNRQSESGKSLIILGAVSVLLSSAGEFYLYLQMQAANREHGEAAQKFSQYSNENLYRQGLHRLLKEVDEGDLSLFSSDYDEIYRSTESCTGLIADPKLAVEKVARKSDQYIWLHKLKTPQTSDQSEKVLSTEEWGAFTGLLKDNSFWAMSSLPENHYGCYDCCMYYFEGYKDGKYHYIRRERFDGIVKDFSVWLDKIKEGK